MADRASRVGRVCAAGAAALMLLAQSAGAAQSDAPPSSAGTQRATASTWDETVRRFAGEHSSAKVDPCRDVVMRFVFPTEVAEVHVRGGERVKQGQLLARARDKDIVAAVEQQKLVAASDLEVQGAKAAADLATFRYEQLKLGKVFTPEDFERAKADAITTRVQFEQAELNLRSQQERLKQLEGQYERYRLEAPFDGIVENVMIEVGKAVGENVDAIRIVNTDQLWLDAYPQTEETLRLDLREGSPAWVLVNLPDAPALIEGKVLYVSPAADYVGQTRRVRVEIPNPKGWPAGLQAAVRFTPPSGEEWNRNIVKPAPEGSTTSDAMPTERIERGMGREVARSFDREVCEPKDNLKLLDACSPRAPLQGAKETSRLIRGCSLEDSLATPGYFRPALRAEAESDCGTQVLALPYSSAEIASASESMR